MLEKVNNKVDKYQDQYSLFGLVLYSNAHPHIIKVLRDNDYWNALDEISGDSIAVMATRLFEGGYDFPNFKTGVLGKMIPIWEEPNKNKKLLKHFNINTSEKPIFIIFCRDESNEIIYYKINIKDDSVENTYSSLKNIIKLITDNIEIEKLEHSHVDEFKKLKNRFNLYKISIKAKQLFNIISTFRGGTGI